jgi:NADH-quinone oxidoreductase subunit N
VTRADVITLLPLIVLAGTSVLAMVGIAVHRSHGFTLGLTLAGLSAAFGCIWIAAPLAPRQVTPLLVIDHYSLFYFGLLIAADLAVALLAYDYLAKVDINREELYILLLIATLGAAVLVASSHFASFFLGLEMLSVSLYAMVSYLRLRRQPLEAGIKYLILAAASAAFLLFGMALVYADLATMEFGRMAEILGMGHANDVVLISGLALIITGIGFKLAVVPFHLWTPDVYEGAPAPVTAFIATVSKGAMFALLLRYFYRSGATNHQILLVFTIIAIASMLAGNLLALLQSNVKRILAYSSIAHMGYLLVAFLASGELAVEAVTFYLVAYFITTVGAFGVVTALSTGDREAEDINDYCGLFWRRPALAGVFTVMLLSLAGIPVTAGFIGKFYIVAAGASSATWALIIILVVSSVIGLFYYLRIIAVMYGTAEPSSIAILSSSSSAAGVVLGALTGLLIWFGVYPEPLLRLIQSTLPK